MTAALPPPRRGRCDTDAVTGEGQLDEAGAVLVRMADGDRGAVGDLDDLLGAAAYGTIRRVVRDPARSEELTQEVFVTCWRAAGRFDAARAGGSARVGRRPRGTVGERSRRRRSRSRMPYRQAEGVTSERTDERVVVLDAAGTTMTTLNPTGAVLWGAIDGARGVEELTDVLVAEFPSVDRSVLQADVRTFVDELLADGLIEQVRAG
ncbi:MAG: PqqD family peptide modification chaperone [Actinomycetota bacterium]